MPNLKNILLVELAPRFYPIIQNPN